MRTTRLLLLAASSAFVLSMTNVQPAVAQTAPSDAWAHSSSDIPAEANIRFGALPNGMRYALMHNATPPGQASFRMRIAAGGLMESDDQKGLAHFTEHMVFNGTKDIPENELLRILERLGLAFGADTNATTSLDQTFYMLELPRTDDETIDASLHIMRQMMSEALMETDDINNERNVIVGETRTRDTPARRSAVAQLGLLAAGQRLASRLPDGNLTNVLNAPAERFVDFYRKYYRPERATFIAVGDFDLDEMEAKVRSTFGGWRGVGPAGAEPDLGRVASRQPETRILLEPGSQSSIDLNWVRNPDRDPDTVAERREDLIQGLGLAVLNRRLGEIARSDNAPFTFANGSTADIFDSVSVGSVSAAFNPGQWKRALEVMEQEQRRLVQFGVSEAELQREIIAMRTALENSVASAATRSTPALANRLVMTTNDNEVFSSPATNLELFNAAVQGLTAEQVNVATRQIFEGQGPVMLLTTPVEIEGGEAAVTAALAASRQVPVTARAEAAALEWPYADFGTPGIPATRTEIADLGITLVTFPNGVRLAVKPTDFRDDQILVSARTGIGQMALPTDQATPAFFSNNIIAPGGTGRLTLDEMSRVLTGRTYTIAASFTPDSIQLSGVTKPEDIDVQLQVLTAYLSDPGLRAAPFEQAKASFPQTTSQVYATPAGAFSAQSWRLLASGDRRIGLPTVEEVSGFKVDDFRRLVRDGLSTGPINVSIVGDITVDEAIRAVAATFGALPTRAPNPAPAPGADRRIFPAPTATPVRLPHNGPAEQALGFIAWPTNDAIGDRLESRQLQILSDVMQLRLNEDIRERQALAYAPRSNSTTSTSFPGYGYIGVTAEVKPESLPVLFESLDRIAADLRDNPITQDELDRAQRPSVETLRRSMNDNGYWLQQLIQIYQPNAVDQIREHVSDMESVTPADIQRLAQTYLRPERAWRAEVVSTQ